MVVCKDEDPPLIGPNVRPPPPEGGGWFGLLLLFPGDAVEIEEKTKGAGGIVDGAVGVPVNDAKTKAGQHT